MGVLYDVGSAVVIEVEFKKHTPFGADALFDPTSPKITITDPNGTDQVLDTLLIKTAIGQWSYTAQTQLSWPTGIYTAKVTAGDGTYTDVTINPGAFKLI